MIGFFAAVNVLIWSEVLYRTETLHVWAGRRIPADPNTGSAPDDLRNHDSPSGGEPAFRSAVPFPR
ncbi:hypothetical protein IQ251_00855 [Saccharopolyspora sp. HNM0983]|uniref:Uncharacterized protein n=1 Tax=Saccharopolyspora montiporae TaxID=2781240 RepID=A0A929B7R8_9PSEU|nr:hypothetical protein [Saccharopolyspora sp. HNM0983]MBE9372986.1 hypothetical protein [Saccharopolyspora sp. HNM0983]